VNRLRAWFTVLVAAVLLPLLLSCVPSNTQSSLTDSAIGSGHFALTTFDGSAESGPNGEDPRGFLRLSGFYDFEATVTCLNVAGNRAVIGYRIVTGSTAGQGFQVEIADNGPTPPSGAPTDAVISYTELPAPPTVCPDPSLLPGGTLTSGDFVVTDATAARPQSKEQCKHRGWRSLVNEQDQPFENRGGCIAFVKRRS
jgi:hypothetical protein